MAKAIFRRGFDALDVDKGVSIRIELGADPQTFPEWVIAQAEEAGAAERISSKPAAEPASSKG